MTEAEWLSSNDPLRMLHYLEGFPDALPGGSALPRKISDRKLRLFACAQCRQMWDGVECGRCSGYGNVTQSPPVEVTPYVGTDAARVANPFGRFEIEVARCPDCRGTGRVGGLADPRSRNAVEVAERYADREATKEERYQALVQAHQVRLETGYEPDGTSTPAHMAHVAVAEDWASIVAVYSRTNTHALVPPATQADLLRCIAGNPFRPIPLPWRQDPPVNKELRPPYCPWLAHNDGAVPKLAQAIYDSRRWDELPILADALEEAGADDGQILDHLRGPGPHVRGCWVLDLLLGKD